MIDVLDGRYQSVKKNARFGPRLKHFPVASDDRSSHGFIGYLFVNASTPGSFWPDRNSRDAPPPVDICVIFDSTPDCATAAAESPPPTIENAFDSATARAMAKVPWANFGFSKTPIGTFHTMVFAERMTSE